MGFGMLSCTRAPHERASCVYPEWPHWRRRRIPTDFLPLRSNRTDLANEVDGLVSARAVAVGFEPTEGINLTRFRVLRMTVQHGPDARSI
jgi:hypothetical protein